MLKLGVWEGPYPRSLVSLRGAIATRQSLYQLIPSDCFATLAMTAGLPS